MACIHAGGVGVDLTLSKITAEMFLAIMVNEYNPSELEWDLIEDKLLSTREYSNSNPLAGLYSITIDDENGTIADSITINNCTRDVGNKEGFYILSIAQSSESSWHTLEVEGSVDAKKIEAEHESIKILGIEDMTFEFLECLQYNGIYFESQDASSVGPAKYYLIDDARNVYSLSGDTTYNEAWENGSINGIAIENLTKLIECNERGRPIWHGAKALRGTLFLYNSISEVNGSGPSEFSENLLSAATEDLEDVQLISGEFEDYIYNSRQYLSLIYTSYSDNADYEKAISCLSEALNGEYEDKNPRYAAETRKIRAEFYASSQKPALAIQEYKEAISRYELLRSSDNKNQENSYRNEVAGCKISLGILMKKYGGNFVKQLSEAVELNPECIRELVRLAEPDQETIDKILSSEFLSRETIKKVALHLINNVEE